MISNPSKNKQIALTMKDTFEKRKRQRCRVFEIKINKTRLKKQQKESLQMMFVESKWCYNYLLNLMDSPDFDIFKFDPKELDFITHKDKDGNDVEAQLKYITSSLKVSLVDRIRSQIKTLHTLKKKHKKAGKLQFKSDYNGIIFKQYGITHKIVSSSKIKVQGIKKPLPVNGLKQLEFIGPYEVANIILCKCGNDFYFKLVVFTEKEDKTKKIYKNEQIGIDFGCQTSLTLSDGSKLNAIVEESERLKRLQRKLSKQVKGSNSRCKTIKMIQKEYRKNSNIKKDLANKIVHELLENNELIVMQDEQLNSWKSKHGKKIQHGILGRVKSKLKENKEQVFVLNRFIPTTKFCSDCGHIHKNILERDRTFICPDCGCIYDRDIHAAENMLWIYNNLKDKIGLGESKFKRADFDEEVHKIFYGLDS